MDPHTCFGFWASVFVWISDFGHRSLFPPHRAKDQVQFFRLAPKFPRFFSQSLLRRSNHPEKEHRLFGFLAARADLVLEIPARDGIVGFAIICAQTCSCTHKLVNKPIVLRMIDTARNLFCKTNDPLAKLRNTLSFVSVSSISCRPMRIASSNSLMAAIFSPVCIKTMPT